MMMKNAGLLHEMRQRLINIELKIDAMRPEDFAGHADQRYGHLTYSQHGEDLLFVALFENMGIARPAYLDIGANHPINCSNTALLRKRGSRGVNIDASPDVIEIFQRERAEDINVNIGAGGSPGILTFYRIDAFSGRNSFSKEAVDAFVREYPAYKIADKIPVRVLTLDQIIAEYCGGECPDLLSIDCEGLDLEILQAFSFETKPAILCVETLSAAGSKDDPIDGLLASRGFRKLVQMGANGIYLNETPR